VTIRDLRIGMATATSLRALFRRVRESGRRVVVNLPHGADTKECFVAVAGSEVFVGPQATLSPIGFAVTTPYARAALDRLGVVPEVLARGKYKSAGESLSLDAMSEAQKEQLGALLDGFHGALTSAISEGRKVDLDRAAQIIDGAPYTGDAAVAAGLADAAVYDDVAMDRTASDPDTAKAANGKKKRGAYDIVSASRYAASRGARLIASRRDKVIGVVRIHGAIVQSGGLFPMQASDERLIRAISRARLSRRVLGVILHIDSPGGSALASDRIHHELVRLAAEKPLVACMANVAASGGYYVAAAAHAIVAEPTTITGSIGVVSARFALEPLLARLGVRTEVLTRGAHAGLLNPTRPLTHEERAVLEREMETIYRAFVDVVAAGRKKSRDEVDALAQGRVWSGVGARARGLVDDLGGFDRALAIARERLGGGGRGAQPVVVDSPRRSRWEHGSELGHAMRAFAELAVDPDRASLLPLALSVSRERVLALCGVSLW
jgi:protease IV